MVVLIFKYDTLLFLKKVEVFRVLALRFSLPQLLLYPPINIGGKKTIDIICLFISYLLEIYKNCNNCWYVYMILTIIINIHVINVYNIIFMKNKYYYIVLITNKH